MDPQFKEMAIQLAEEQHANPDQDEGTVRSERSCTLLMNAFLQNNCSRPGSCNCCRDKGGRLYSRLRKLEQRGVMMHAGVPSLFGLGLEKCHVLTFCSLLYEPLQGCQKIVTISCQ